MSFDASSSSSPSQMVWIHPNKLHILNATQSNTRSLPSELLSIIFQHACSTPNIFGEEHAQMPTPRPFHLVLRLVSTLWCDISQSTPQLWASVFLPELSVEDIDIRAQYLKLCLNNSGDLPLTLALQFDPKLREAGCFISPIVDATLEHSAHRIRALRLLQPPLSWLEILIPRMCQLSVMQVYILRILRSNRSKVLDERLFLPNTANIKRISVYCPGLVDFRLECTMESLTHVNLTLCPIDFVIEFLLKCPNLINFHYRFPALPSKVKDPRSVLTSPLVLSHLSKFTWSSRRVPQSILEWYTVLYQHIHFPALRRFIWVLGPLASMNDTPDLLPLFKLPKSVTTLELGSVRFDSIEETLNHFLPLTGVTQLRLIKFDEACVEQTFSVLSQGTNESNTLFPKLTSIIIDRRHTVRWIRLKSWEKLVQMLRCRMGLIDHFTLTEKKTLVTRRWNNKIRDALRKLKREGLDLTIIEGGHPIPI